MVRHHALLGYDCKMICLGILYRSTYSSSPLVDTPVHYTKQVCPHYMRGRINSVLLKERSPLARVTFKTESPVWQKSNINQNRACYHRPPASRHHTVIAGEGGGGASKTGTPNKFNPTIVPL